MRCAEVSRRLFADDAEALGAEVTSHLAECPRCGALAERLGAVQEGLRGHRADFAPDAGFSARVVAGLPGTTEVLGWAALRLLPAGLTLALLCSWYSATHGPGLSDQLLHPDEGQLFNYVALGPSSEGGR